VAEIATPADLRQPMYMLLNLGVGDTGSWPGKYDPSMPTVHMQIDYVRAWQYGASSVTGPADVAAFGGTYTLRADGVSDLYDFTKAKVALSMDASGLSTAGTHTVWASPLGSVVRGGPGNVNFAGGSGEDTFIFGSGLSRASGGAGNDTFVFVKGGLTASDQITDFRLDLSNGTEHDTLQLFGFSEAARLELVGTTVNASGTGALHSYRVVDGDYVSPNVIVQTTNGTSRLSALDYHFG
jgi:Ca2+-binding RTX toxin-like protein